MLNYPQQMVIVELLREKLTYFKLCVNEELHMLYLIKKRSSFYGDLLFPIYLFF